MYFKRVDTLLVDDFINISSPEVTVEPQLSELSWDRAN